MNAFDDFVRRKREAQGAQPQSESVGNAFDDFVGRKATPTADKQPAPKQDDYAVSTATNLTEKNMEGKKRGREGFAGERAVDAIESAGYGAARAGTLGAVDRLVGLGTSIGESAASTEQNPANPNAYKEGRDEYLKGEEESARFSPVSNFIGSAAGGVVPQIALSPLSIASKLQQAGKTGSVAQALGRAGDAAVVGGIGGALNTYKDDPVAMLGGAAVGALAGAGLDATVGNMARRAIRGAPKREEAAFISDVVESEAGRATPTTGKKLARDIEDVADMRKVYPEVAAATRHNAPAGPAIKVVKDAQNRAMDGQADRYASVDKALGKKGQLTDVKLLEALVKAEEDLPTFALESGIPILQKIRDNVRTNLVPRWTGVMEPTNKAIPLTTENVRELTTTVQGTAEAAMGSINGTNASKIPTEVSKAVNKILERRLDAAAAAGAKAEVDAIREADRRFAALKRIEGALNDREWKETSKAMGISGRMAQQQKNTENAAALAMTAVGNPEAAIAIKARGPISSAYNYSAREINDRLLKPLQEAADAGKSWAEITRYAAEIGAPQAVARAIYERSQGSSLKTAKKMNRNK